MKAKIVIHSLVIVLILLGGIEISFGQAIPEEAKRYFDRGLAAVEMAKTPADYEKAIAEAENPSRADDLVKRIR